MIKVRRRPEKLVSASLDALNAGNLFRAKELALRAILIRSDCVEAWSSLASAELQARDYQAAREAAEEAVRIAPGFASAWHNLGEAHRHAGEAYKSLECQNRALILDQDTAQFWLGRGTTLMMLDRHVTAIACFDRALAVDPSLHAATVNRGMAVLRADNARSDLLATVMDLADRLAKGQLDLKTAPLETAAAFTGSPAFDAELIRCFDCVVQGELQAEPNARTWTLARVNLMLAVLLHDPRLVHLCQERLDEINAGRSYE